MCLCESEIRTEAWRGYVADSLWMIATRRAGANNDGSPAYRAYTDIMNNTTIQPAPRGDERTAEQVKNDLLAKLDRLAGDE